MLSFLLALFYGFDNAHGQVRVAIGASKETEAIEAVITARLSDDPQLVLLDRANFGLRENERSLAVASERARQLDAAILVILEKVPDTLPSLVSLRIVETRSATVLFHRLFPEDDASGTSTEAIASRISTIATTVETVGSAPRPSVALLGLRFEVPQTENPAKEFALNQLIASSLQQHGELRVLERWQSEALLFERIAREEESPPLDGGELLIDGTLSEGGGRLIVSLRIRRSDDLEGSRIAIEQAGTDFGGAAAAVTEEVVKAAGASTGSADSGAKTEANLFAALALWALTNGLAEEGVAATETAVALDPKVPSHILRRAQAHAFRAWPRPIATDFLDDRKLGPDDFEPVSRLRSMLFSLRLLDDFEALVETSGFELDDTEREKANAFAVRLLRDAISVVGKTYDLGLDGSVPNELSNLRRQVKGRIEALAASPSLETRMDVCFYLISSVSAFSETPGDAFGSMRFLLGVDLGPNEFRRDAVRMVFADGLHQEFGDNGNRTSVPNHAKLLLSPRTSENDRRAWLELAGNMASAPAARDRITAQTLRAHLLREDRAALNLVLAEFADLVWEERALLAETAPNILDSARILFTELCQAEVPVELRDFNRRFLSDLLSNRQRPEAGAIAFFGHRLLTWTADDATALLQLMETCGPRLISVARDPAGVERSLQLLRNQLGIAARINSPAPSTSRPSTPSKEPTATDGDALVARELFVPGLALRPQQNYSIGATSVIHDESGEFWMKLPDGILRFRPESPDPPEFLHTPGRPHQAIDNLAVGSNHIVVAIGTEIWIADKNDGNWWQRAEVPPQSYSVFGSGDRFYLVYRPKRGEQGYESGILALDPTTRSFEVVTSSRREPKPGTPDGRPDWMPELAFSFGGKIAVVGKVDVSHPHRHEMFVRGTADEGWAPLLANDALVASSFTSRNGDSLVVFGGGNFLGWRDLEQVVRFPFDGREAELLVGWGESPPPNPLFSNAAVLPGPPRFRLPPPLAAPLPNQLRQTAVVPHGERLFLITVDIATGAERTSSKQMLHVLERDGSSKSVPLGFRLSADSPIRDRLSEADIRKVENPNPVPGRLFVVDDALYVGVNSHGVPTVTGFWKIPFSDIETALSQTRVP